ncbi:MAG: hypothetical protein HeimC2_16060 [Candidatus Heimdallarchaeota archaeon LC_2]|nr:MAG: hypothetical protein HeimC2_16060 [Candidatus Heimdallarchaeota archaeon LC_2]
MSEQVQNFNPILVLIWILQLIILAMDYSSDGAVSWSIPVIGSFLLVQLYMVWKTNYDEMVEEQNQRMMAKYGDPKIANTPTITPGITNLQLINTNLNKKSQDPIIQLNLAPSVTLDDQDEEDNMD